MKLSVLPALAAAAGAAAAAVSAAGTTATPAPRKKKQQQQQQQQQQQWSLFGLFYHPIVGLQLVIDPLQMMLTLQSTPPLLHLPT